MFFYYITQTLHGTGIHTLVWLISGVFLGRQSRRSGRVAWTHSRSMVFAPIASCWSMGCRFKRECVCVCVSHPVTKGLSEQGVKARDHQPSYTMDYCMNLVEVCVFAKCIAINL